MAEDTTPAYMQQQKIPGWTGAINNMLRALLEGDSKSANPLFGGGPPPVSPGPYQPPIAAPPPMTGTPMMPPQPPVPYKGISGSGPMGPLLMQPPQGR